MNILSPSPASLWRRLVAIFYDLLVIFACLVVLTAISTAFGIQFGRAHYPYYSIAVLFLVFLYFAWSWTHGGQTIGMKVWNIYLYSTRLPSITWLTAVSRYGSAFFSWLFAGFGFLWSLVDAKNRTWHDYFSDSYLVHIPRTKKPKKNKN